MISKTQYTTIPVIHHPDLTIPMPEGHRFPMSKFKHLHDILVQRNIVPQDAFYQPELPTRRQLSLVHDMDYINAFTNETLDIQAQKRIGLPCGPDLTHRSYLAVGATMLTCKMAIQHGIALSTAGGTHHAHRDFGSGFCIFNDIAVAAAYVLDHGWVQRVLIIDLDVHQGDGTAAIFQNDSRVFTFSMHGEKQFPLRKMKSNWDIPLENGTNDDTYLRLLENALPKLIETAKPDLIIYDAGVDPHRDDRLGRMLMTNNGLHQRDQQVLQIAKKHSIPIAAVIGGGYDHDHLAVAQRHAILHLTAFGQFP